jgi:hypothetical protein
MHVGPVPATTAHAAERAERATMPMSGRSFAVAASSGLPLPAVSVLKLIS